MVPSPSLALLGFQVFTNRSQSENPLARPRVFFLLMLETSSFNCKCLLKQLSDVVLKLEAIFARHPNPTMNQVEPI